MRKLAGIAALTLCIASLTTTAAHADPIECPPGQVATLNPSDGGWTCVNNGGNTNNSEDPKNPNKDKGDFAK